MVPFHFHHIPKVQRTVSETVVDGIALIVEISEGFDVVLATSSMSYYLLHDDAATLHIWNA